MTKIELIKAVAAKTEMSQKDAAAAVAAVLGTIEETVCKGENVQLIGFGSFELKTRAPRTVRSLRTGETITTAETKYPAFKAGKSFKDMIK